MSTTEILDVDSGVETLDVGTDSVSSLEVVTGTVTTAAGDVGTPLVIDVATGAIGALAVSGTPVQVIDVILGPQGPQGDEGPRGLQGPQGGDGPAGPASTIPGPQGPPGTGLGSGAAQKTFAIAALSWEFEHDLGFPPAVMLYTSEGVVITGNIVVNTDKVTRVEWYYPLAGSMSVS